jgi:hypothetical protein
MQQPATCVLTIKESELCLLISHTNGFFFLAALFIETVDALEHAVAGFWDFFFCLNFEENF